jgi:hypothetical protein
MDYKADEKVAIDHGDEVHDAHVAVQLAHDVENQKLSPWTPRMFRLYFILACAYLCGCLVSASRDNNKLVADYGRTDMMAVFLVVLTA